MDRQKKTDDNEKEGTKRIGKAASAAILLIMILLIAACFKLQMELNEIRRQYETLKDEVDAARIERDRQAEAYRQLEDHPDDYLEDKAYEQGYRKPTDRDYINDMPAE